jgi:MFS family permease
VPEWAVLLAVGLGTMLAPINSTMIAVALPRILGEFDAGVGASAWLVTAYLVAMATLQPIAGALGDRFGRRRLMLLGLGWFGLVSLGAAAAGSFFLLAACRIQQGIAAAIALPNGTAVARDILPPARRARGFSTIGALTGVAAAGGPPLGGLLVGSAGWRAMFLANVPIVVSSLLLAWWAVPRGVDDVEPASGPRRGWLPRLAHGRVYAAACAGVCLSNLAFYVTLLVVPLVLAARPGQSAAQTGTVLSVLLLASLCCTPLGGYLADRVGRRAPAVGGLVLMTVGLGVVALVTRGTGGEGGGELSLMGLVAGLALAGAGLGTCGPGMQTSALEAAGPTDVGAAAGLYSTSRYVGSITGSAALAALASGGGAGAGALPNLDVVFVMVLAAAVLSVVACVGLRDVREVRDTRAVGGA